MPSEKPQPGTCGSLISKWQTKYGRKMYCTQPAGWRTDHLGSGRCRLHGGLSTGPKTSFGYFIKRLWNEDERELLKEYLDLSQDEQLEVGPALATANMLLIRCVNIISSDGDVLEEKGVNFPKECAMKYALGLLGRIAQLIKAAKEQREVQEVRLKVMLIQSLTETVVEAFNYANRYDEPEERTRHFVKMLERLRPLAGNSENFRNN